MQDDFVFRWFLQVFGGSRRERERFQEIFRRGKGAQRFQNFPKRRFSAKPLLPVRFKSIPGADFEKRGLN